MPEHHTTTRFKHGLNEGGADFRRRLTMEYADLIGRGRAETDPEKRKKLRDALRAKLQSPEGSLPKTEITRLAKQVGVELSPEDLLNFKKIIDTLIPTEAKATEPEKIYTPEDTAIPSELMPEDSLETDQTILPASEHGAIGQGEGEHPMGERRLFPRAKLILQLLRDNGIDIKEDCIMIQGKNPEGTFRNETYKVIIPVPLKKIILVCDEENNATYIVHELTPRPQKYYTRSKTSLDELEQRAPTTVSKIPWDSDESKWALAILSALTSTPNQVETHTTLSGLSDEQAKEVILNNVKPGHVISSGELTPQDEASIRHFLGSHTTETLSKRKGVASKLYSEFVTLHGPVSMQHFKDILGAVRTERGVTFAPRPHYDSSIRAQAKDFIEAASTTDQKDAHTLYETFLTTHQIAAKDFSFGAFQGQYSLLVEGGTRQGPAILKTKEYVDSLDPNELDQTIKTLEAQYLAFMHFHHLKPSFAKFHQLVRKRKKAA